MTHPAAGTKKIEKTDRQWRKELTPEQYRLMREKGTEFPFAGIYVNEKSPGIYHCAACDLELFASETKYDSGSGWPSFWDIVQSGSVKMTEDLTAGLTRTEIHCARCSAHLGHVFSDGPQPTGLRYCVNSGALQLAKRLEANSSQT